MEQSRLAEICRATIDPVKREAAEKELETVLLLMVSPQKGGVTVAVDETIQSTSLLGYKIQQYLSHVALSWRASKDPSLTIRAASASALF